MLKKLIAVAVVAAAVAGCRTPGYVKATEVQAVVHAVCDRHDMYVRADKNVDPPTQASDLRSSQLLRQVVDEAVAAVQSK